jgi:hypothetical protein
MTQYATTPSHEEAERDAIPYSAGCKKADVSNERARIYSHKTEVKRDRAHSESSYGAA